MSESTLIEKILDIDGQLPDNDSIRVNTLYILSDLFEDWEEFDKESYHFDSIYALINECFCNQNSNVFIKAWNLVKNIAGWLLNFLEEVRLVSTKIIH